MWRTLVHPSLLSTTSSSSPSQKIRLSTFTVTCGATRGCPIVPPIWNGAKPNKRVLLTYTPHLTRALRTKWTRALPCFLTLTPTSTYIVTTPLTRGYKLAPLAQCLTLIHRTVYGRQRPQLDRWHPLLTLIWTLSYFYFSVVVTVLYWFEFEFIVQITIIKTFDMRWDKKIYPSNYILFLAHSWYYLFLDMVKILLSNPVQCQN